CRSTRPHPILTYRCVQRGAIHSFPTRRSSDLGKVHLPETTERLGVRSGLRMTEKGVCLPHPRNACTARGFFHDAPEMSAKHSKRSEEHTSELQSRGHIVCRLLLEKKKYHVYHK